MTGEIEKEGKTLVIKRIHVAYRLVVDPDVDRDVIDRVMGFYAERCPVARSVGGCIDLSDEIELIPGT